MRILFISDLHLSESDAATTARFFSFMREVAPGADALYVLGDLFHVWLGDALIEESDIAKRTIESFALLNKENTRIYFIHGNRDFLLGAHFFRATGVELLPQQAVIRLGDTRTLLLHGDELCTDDRAYQRARRVLRSRALSVFANAIPLWLRHRIAARIRRASKAHLARTSMNILDANRDAITAMFAKHDAPLMIHGHTHRPTDETIDIRDGKRRRIVLSDWQQDYGYLEWVDGEFFVHAFPR
jgi:UDP-2,3-diacylglucosamine hydrolase